MPEKRPRIIPPHPAVQKFYSENPQPSWDKMLTFLINTFPQVEDGSIKYLIEGGVAVHLLKPQRQTPDDVDLIYREHTNDFNMLPAKSANTWLISHKIPVNSHNITYLFQNSTTVEFGGKQVYLLNPAALTFSKTASLYSNPPREKDLDDAKLLDIDQAEITEFKQGFIDT